MITRFTNWLSRVAGPNTAHVIDAAIALGLVGSVAYVSSPAARVFLNGHSRLATLVGIGIPVATAAASKFRKAAGSQNDQLVEQFVAAVRAELDATTPGTKPTDPTT